MVAIDSLPSLRFFLFPPGLSPPLEQVWTSVFLNQVVGGYRAHRTGLTGTVEHIGVPSATGKERGLFLPALRTLAIPIGLLPVEVVFNFFSVESFPHLLIERKLCFLVRTKWINHMLTISLQLYFIIICPMSQHLVSTISDTKCWQCINNQIEYLCWGWWESYRLYLRILTIGQY